MRALRLSLVFRLLLGPLWLGATLATAGAQALQPSGVIEHRQSQATSSFTLRGPLNKVVDGDTLDIDDAQLGVVRVRLAAIDAPELSVQRRATAEKPKRQIPAQAFGRQSSEHLQRLLSQQPQSQLRAECSQWERRRHDQSSYLPAPQEPSRSQRRSARPRAICRVWHGATDVNWAQVQAGYAWVYRSVLHEQTPANRAQLLAAEASAQAARRGLWADPEPLAPWRWRFQRRAY